MADPGAFNENETDAIPPARRIVNPFRVSS
jgi:hypothetical protein